MMKSRELRGREAMNGVGNFEMYAQEYDAWFDANRFAYESEVLALKRFIPAKSRGLEVGVGTGRFASLLGIRIGVEPAKAMADIARKRGIEVHGAMKDLYEIVRGSDKIVTF